MIKSTLLGIALTLLVGASYSQVEELDLRKEAKIIRQNIATLPNHQWQKIGDYSNYAAVSNGAYNLIVNCEPKSRLGEPHITLRVIERGGSENQIALFKTNMQVLSSGRAPLTFEPREEKRESPYKENEYPMQPLLDALKEGQKVKIGLQDKAGEYEFTLANSERALAHCREHE